MTDHYWTVHLMFSVNFSVQNGFEPLSQRVKGLIETIAKKSWLRDKKRMHRLVIYAKLKKALPDCVIDEIQYYASLDEAARDCLSNTTD